MNKIVMKIDGMACDMCEAHVNEAIRKAIPEAKKVSSSHKKGEASFLTENAPDVEKLRGAIAATGYSVQSVETLPYEKKGFLFWK